jgi:hypothetical protein
MVTTLRRDLETIRVVMSERDRRRRRAAAPSYPDKPVEYCRDMLGVTLTPDQETILRHLLVPPCIVNVPSANDTGKTFLAACAVSWWFDSFSVGAVYTVAPKLEHLTNVLWSQLRILRRRAGLPNIFNGPRAPMAIDGPDHLALGITAAKGESFKGRHIGRKLFIMEEAVGLPHLYFDELPTMLDEGDSVLYIYNPTDVTSRMYTEDVRGETDCDDDLELPEEQRLPWHRFPLSALRHPNIEAELAGRERPFPGAVSLKMLRGMIRAGCEPIAAEQAQGIDFEFPPGSGKWYRPGAWFQARGLGLWPDTGSGVWSDSTWAACFKKDPGVSTLHLPMIGCDTATGKGEDYHAVHVRWGAVSVWHETSNTLKPVHIGQRLKLCAEQAAGFYNSARPSSAEPIKPQAIPINIDDDGTGGAIASYMQAEGYFITPLGAGARAMDEERYPRKRDELWFRAADRARAGDIYLGRLDKPTLRRLRQQLMAPAFTLDSRGRRQVEPKDDTKQKIGRSPDDADAMLLAYYDAPTAAYVEMGEPWNERDRPRRSWAAEAGIFGAK